MKDSTILKAGIIGSLIAVLCCFTPALVLLFGAIGLSAWLAWIGYILLPALILFVAIAAYGLFYRHRKKEN